MATTYPNTKYGRMAQLEARIADLEKLLATGVASSSIDGHTVNNRPRHEIIRDISAMKSELYQLETGKSTLMGTAYQL